MVEVHCHVCGMAGRPTVAEYVAQLEARVVALEAQRDRAVDEATELRRDLRRQQETPRQWRRDTAADRDDRRAAQGAQALETILRHPRIAHEPVEKVRAYLARERRTL